jgi:hypothetical protein
MWSFTEGTALFLHYFRGKGKVKGKARKLRVNQKRKERLRLKLRIGPKFTESCDLWMCLLDVVVCTHGIFIYMLLLRTHEEVVLCIFWNLFFLLRLVSEQVVLLILWHICWKPRHFARQWHNKCVFVTAVMSLKNEAAAGSVFLVIWHQAGSDATMEHITLCHTHQQWLQEEVFSVGSTQRLYKESWWELWVSWVWRQSAGRGGQTWLGVNGQDLRPWGALIQPSGGNDVSPEAEEHLPLEATTKQRDWDH